MSVVEANVAAGPRLGPFDPSYAAEIASWVTTPEEAHWLAPATDPPLTEAKVLGWIESGRRPFLFTREEERLPLGYGELNAMRGRVDHLWLGHVVVRPDQRGKGTGGALVAALLAEAFGPQAVTRVSLIVFPDNTAALQCYVRAGFVQVGEEWHRFGRSGPKQRLLRLEIAVKT